ncbi:probable rhamnogalacturonate lyase B [Andrographis paniculata]|uniref:probable rhamnogalacturonate lyase B n=1 Tax=Andrographis paniculata TaxID=175694 RepID=UPI0021E8FF91|nr:probable rhamnogalacturonate lyase B [Andrographis paniculata]
MVAVVLRFFSPPVAADSKYQAGQGHVSFPVKLYVSQKNVDIDNGIVKLILTRPGGLIAAIEYKGIIDNVLEKRYHQNRRGYWDMVWTRLDKVGTSHFDMLESKSYKIVIESEDQVEVSFTSTWNVSYGHNTVPLNIDKRFIVLRGVSGFYSYTIFEHLEGWPDLNIDEARIAFKLRQDLFHYMAISDDKQRMMPSNEDRKVGHVLDYAEAVRLNSSPKFKQEVDDKYQYSLESKENRVHGWIATLTLTNKSAAGFWVITASDEFRGGGPLKQDLTSHVGPTSLSMFFSSHYAGVEFGIRLRNGEFWKKVFGPVFIYLNSHDSILNPINLLWEDAKRQMLEESKKWPYEFPLSSDFGGASERGAMSGKLLINDKYINSALMPAKHAYVGLAPPGDAGSWQRQSKGYQFWRKTDEHGQFNITSVRAGIYNLYAWVPGFIGDYRHHANITITPGKVVEAGDLIYSPPRAGPTLWEIGIPDRSASEFYVPDPNPDLVNTLYTSKHKDRFRQYGLWDRYTDLYPTHDLIYTVGLSDYTKHWFFAHLNRKLNKDKYTSTTWRVVFPLTRRRTNVTTTTSANYTLRLALASANYAEIQVWMNNPNPSGQPHFSTRRIGMDNAIARHGIHGLYWLYSIDLFESQFVDGENTLYIRQAKGSSPFNGVLYDYIRLEGPPQYLS